MYVYVNNQRMETSTASADFLTWVVDVKTDIKFRHGYRKENPSQLYLYACLPHKKDDKYDHILGPLTLQLYVLPHQTINANELYHLCKDKIQWEFQQNVSKTSRRDFLKSEEDNIRRYAQFPGILPGYQLFEDLHLGNKHYIRLQCSHRTTFEICIRYLTVGFYRNRNTFDLYRDLDAIKRKESLGSEIVPQTTDSFCRSALLQGLWNFERLTINVQPEPSPTIVFAMGPDTVGLPCIPHVNYKLVVLNYRESDITTGSKSGKAKAKKPPGALTKKPPKTRKRNAEDSVDQLIVNSYDMESGTTKQRRLYTPIDEYLTAKTGEQPVAAPIAPTPAPAPALPPPPSVSTDTVHM